MPTTVSYPAHSVELFCFASKNSRNIELGILHQKWAVATLLNQQSMQGRITKARKYFRPGSVGLLYCNPTHSFTTPFIAQSEADPDYIDTDTWPEAWCLPFKIRTLGDLSRQLPAEIAKERWPFLKSRLTHIGGRGGVSAALKFTGTTVFVPTTISVADWLLVCEDLAFKPLSDTDMAELRGR